MTGYENGAGDRCWESRQDKEKEGTVAGPWLMSGLGSTVRD